MLRKLNVVYYSFFAYYYINMRASLVVQLVKNLPGMQETLVQFLGWKVTLEKG